MERTYQAVTKTDDNAVINGDYVFIVEKGVLTDAFSLDPRKPNETIIIPDCVTEIDRLNGENYSKENYGWSIAKTVIIPHTVKKIDRQGIQCFDNLTELTIPSSVKSIGYQGLASNSSLKKVVFEEGCTFIDQWAFREDYSLKEVYLPKSLTKISYDITLLNAFDGIEKQVTIYAQKDSHAYDYCKNTLGMKVVDTTPKTPAALTGLKVSKNTASTVKLSWKTSKNANQYYIYEYSSKKWNKIGMTGSLNYTATNLTAGSSLKFKVVPVNVQTSDSKTATGATITTYTKNTTPVMNTVTKKTSSSAQITFSQDKSVQYYEIYTSKNGKSYTKVDTVKNSSSGKTNYTLKKGLKKSGTNYIKIRAYSTINKTKVYTSYSNVMKVSLK